MNALYRIVNALLAAAIFPVILFMDFFYFRASTSIAEAGFHETLNFMDFIEIYKGDHLLSTFIKPGSGAGWPAGLAPLNARLIASAVALVAVVVIAIFIIIWSCFSNKRIPVLIAAGLGIASTIVMICCFGSASNAVISGEINIIEVIAGSGIISSIVGGLVDIEAFDLGGFQNGILIAFGAMVLWTAAYYVIELGEPKEEKETKKKH